MTSQPAEQASLEDVRREIDAIDVAILELLKWRFDAIGRVSAAKRSAGPAMRPAREAELLRRLLAARRDPLPAQTVFQVWREIIGIATQMQTPMRVLITSSAAANGAFRDLVRGHFGAAAPVVALAAGTDVIAALAAADADVAVVAPNEPGWLSRLDSGAGSEIRAIGRLPFLAAGPAEGFVLGRMPVEPTGEDETLIAVDAPDAAGVLALGGLEPRRTWPWAGEGGRAMTLAAVPGVVSADLLGEIARRNGPLALRVLGSYPSPLA